MNKTNYLKVQFALVPLLVGLTVQLVSAANTPESKVTTIPKIFGHRGGRKWAPENSLSSFKQCVEHGYGIELDIHRCKTGELVVIHDEDLQRTTNGSGFIKDKTLAELRALSNGKWFGDQFSNDKIPLLSEVLSLVDGKVPIYVEIKNSPVGYPGIEDDLIALLKGYKNPGSITIISFDHQVLHSLHQKEPSYRLGFLDSAIPYSVSDYANRVGATAWHPEFSAIRTDNVEDAHRHGLLVNVWTLNKEPEWRAAIDEKIDAIVTDDPEGLDRFLKSNLN